MTPSLRTIYRKRVGVSLCDKPTTDRITNVWRRRMSMTMIRPISDVVYGICRGLPSGNIYAMTLYTKWSPISVDWNKQVQCTILSYFPNSSELLIMVHNVY